MPAQPDFESCPRNNKNYRKDEKGLSRNIHARYLARLARQKGPVPLKARYSLFAPALDYRETPLYPDWPVRLNRQRGVEQIGNGPDPIRDAQSHTRRGPQGLMDTAEIVMGHIEADRSRVVGQGF
jgi:hypothetical protein